MPVACGTALCLCVSIGGGSPHCPCSSKRSSKVRGRCSPVSKQGSGDFWLHFVQKQSVCIVSANGRGSGNRERSYLSVLQPNETAGSEFLRYTGLNPPWSSFIPCTEYVSCNTCGEGGQIKHLQPVGTLSTAQFLVLQCNAFQVILGEGESIECFCLKR